MRCNVHGTTIALLIITLAGFTAAQGDSASLSGKLSRSSSSASITDSVSTGDRSDGQWSMHSVGSKVSSYYDSLRRPAAGVRTAIKGVEQDLQPNDSTKAQVKGFVSSVLVGLITFMRYGPVYGGAAGYVFLVSTDPNRVTATTVAILALAIYSNRVNRSVPYEEGDKLVYHNGTYEIPELALELRYQIDRTCGVDVEYEVTSGVECSPISKVNQNWEHWQDKKIGGRSTFMRCEFYNTHIFEYGCALGSHQHCVAIAVDTYNQLHFVHQASKVLLSNSNQDDVQIIPEQEYDFPHVAVATDDKFYENSESYAVYHETECVVTIEEGKATIQSQSLDVHYDLASMHWDINMRKLETPKHTVIGVEREKDVLIARVKVTPKTATLIIRPPDSYDTKCSLECRRSEKSTTTSVYDYHGDNMVDITPRSGKGEVCLIRNAYSVYYLHPGVATRVGIAEPKIYTESHSVNCPYVKVKDLSANDKLTSSDYIAGFGLDLGGVGDKVIAVVMCVMLAYVLGPSLITAAIIMFIFYSNGLITKAEAISVQNMHRADSFSTTVEIAALVYQLLLGKMGSYSLTSLIPATVIVALYPYRSERVNLTSLTKLFVAFFGDWPVIRVPLYTAILIFRHTPDFKKLITEALHMAEEAKRAVTITTDENSPPIREHSVAAALARIRLQRDHGKPQRRYFINRPVVNRIRRNEYKPTPRPILSFSRIRQVSGVVFYPEEYEIIRKHIKHMSTCEIIRLKAFATWVHGRGKWDFTEVAPYADGGLAEELSRLSAV